MTTTKLASILTVKLKRRVRSKEIDLIAESLGKVKQRKTHGQAMACYYWNETEIETVINKLD